jgi:hypothetical protein
VSFITERDDRVNVANQQVSFKPGSNHIGKCKNQELAALIRSHTDDDDMSV